MLGGSPARQSRKKAHAAQPHSAGLKVRNKKHPREAVPGVFFCQYRRGTRDEGVSEPVMPSPWNASFLQKPYSLPMNWCSHTD